MNSILFFFTFILIIFIISVSIYIISESKKSYQDIIPKEPLIYKDSEQEYKDCQEYFAMIKNGTLYNKDKIYKLSNNPKISIVIPVHNGEALIKEAVISVQNQDLKDLEIIIINDYSTDNSSDIIKELMKTEPRIRYYQNEENRGAFYTKTKGVLLAKGKYVLILDDDDKYLQRDAFTTLYSEAEKDNLDILKYNFISNHIFSNRESYNHNNNEEPIITQPQLSNLFLFKGEDGKIHQNLGVLWNQIFRTDLFVKVINQIDKKYFNEKMNCHDDYLLYFLLTRNAKRYRKINRMFYIVVYLRSSTDPKIIYRRKEKNKDVYNLKCNAYLVFIEVVFDKTENNKDDKKIAFSQLATWYLHNECKNNQLLKKEVLKFVKNFWIAPLLMKMIKMK